MSFHCKQLEPNPLLQSSYKIIVINIIINVYIASYYGIKSFTKVSDYGFFGTVSKTLFFHLIQVLVSLSLFSSLL